MPFQQPSFSPYPVNPRRSAAMVPDYGQGITQAGKGLEGMMSSFQNMKERRQRNLMALTKEEREQATFERMQAEAEAKKVASEAKAAEVKEWKDYNLKLLEDKANKEELEQNRLEAHFERQNKLELERMRAQKVAGTPTSISGTADAPQTTAMPQTPIQPMTPTTPGGFREPAPIPELIPEQPSLAEYVHKATSTGQKLDPQILQQLYPKDAREKGHKYPYTEDEVKDYFKYQQENWRKTGGSGKPNIEDDRGYIVNSLEDTYQSMDQLKSQIDVMDEEFAKTPKLDFFTGEVVEGEFHENKMARQRQLQPMRKDFRRLKSNLPKLRALYKQKFGKAYVPPKVRAKIKAYADKNGISFDKALDRYLVARGALSAN